MLIQLKTDTLFTKCQEIKEDNFKDVFQKAIQVKSWIKNKAAYGVAFNQLGFTERAFVTKKPKSFKFPAEIIMNPSYEGIGKQRYMEEACLSYPGQKFNILRYEKIKFKYYDYYEKKYVEVELDGIASIVAQHETSHLDGEPDEVLHKDLDEETFTRGQNDTDRESTLPDQSFSNPKIT